MQHEEIVFKTLKDAGKPLKGGEIAQTSGLDKKAVDKALKTLQNNGKIFSPARCYYEPKK